jgi:hypothetical protein
MQAWDATPQAEGLAEGEYLLPGGLKNCPG